MIFFDNASTTPVYPEVADIIRNFYVNDFYNPSATYKPSFEVKNAISDARKKLASYLGANETEIFFTSCATESNNWGIISGFKNKNGNIVISAGEHASVYETAKSLECRGLDVRFASLLPDGRVDVNDLLKKTDNNTCLVSVMHVSNETGVINDLAKISREIKEINPKVIFHSDGVQAFLKTDNDVTKNGVDMYSVSGHKFHAPKGIGMLYINKKIHLAPLINGGGQESGNRSGTENVAGIVAMAKAAEMFKSEYDKKAVDENYYTLIQMLNKIDESVILGNSEINSHLIVAVSFPGCKAESLQTMLAEDGILVGRGSACSSHHAGNRILHEMKVSQKIIDGAMRLSISPTTTKEDIVYVCEKIKNKAEALRGHNIG